jgi:DNA-binding transcriptional LysR family regulator
MDNRKYEALLLVAEHGSITRASEIMGYTQSGITQMINSLEKDLGIKLLTRTNKGAVLTNAGKRLLPYMRQENKWENHIRQECANMRGLETGSVTVGCLSSISAAWMPDILKHFAEKHPGIRVYMREAESEAIEEMLLTGRIDVAITELKNQKTYDSRTLRRDEIFAILPREHELADRQRVSLRELTKYPFISYSTGNAGVDEPGFPEVVTNNRYRFNVMYSCKNDFTALEMVNKGLGISICGELMLSNHNVDNARIPLDPPLYRILGIAIRNHETPLPATQIFIQCVEEVTAR